ncbi:MAG: ABC transporter ATP-binding protein/permease [Clostridiales bacterium]|nr:ABC transporter ATP-binding protein/permease [Clostridiales bacterium]
MSNNTALLWIRGALRGRWPRIVIQIFIKCLSVACGVIMALFLRDVIDAAVSGLIPLLIEKLLRLLALMTLQYGLSYAAVRMQATINILVSTDIKRRMMRGLFHRSYAQVSDYHSGELMNRLITDADNVASSATSMLPNLISMALTILIVGILLAAMSWQLLVLAVVMGLVAALGALLLRNKAKRLQRDVREKEGKVRGFMQEALLNLPVIKAFTAAAAFTGRLKTVQDASVRSRIKQQRFSTFMHTLMGFGFSIGYLVALGWCGAQLALGAISYGTLTAILQLVTQIRAPIAGFGNVVPNYYAMLVSAERLIELEELTAEDEPAEDMGDLTEINVRGLTFGYDPDEPVLKDIDLTVGRGDLVALTGRSGIGKSTLMKVLLALYQPQDGTMTAWKTDGTALPISAGTRAAFAYVPQGNMLFSGTIAENVTLFAEDASEEEIWEALRIADAEGFIREMPEGLDSLLREDGQGVSEGQAQRIAVARALFTRAPVLLLDEATSALDEQTELTLLRNIRAAGHTCLIISHRPGVMEIATKQISF